MPIASTGVTFLCSARGQITTNLFRLWIGSCPQHVPGEAVGANGFTLHLARLVVSSFSHFKGFKAEQVWSGFGGWLKNSDFFAFLVWYGCFLHTKVKIGLLKVLSQVVVLHQPKWESEMEWTVVLDDAVILMFSGRAMGNSIQKGGNPYKIYYMYSHVTLKMCHDVLRCGRRLRFWCLWIQGDMQTCSSTSPPQCSFSICPVAIHCLCS